MGYYDNEPPPRHAHRTPAELAEDEIIAAFRDSVCPRSSARLALTSDGRVRANNTNGRNSDVSHDKQYGHES
jgi:hypothetical protein